MLLKFAELIARGVRSTSGHASCRVNRANVHQPDDGPPACSTHDADDQVEGIRAFGIAQTSLVVTFNTWVQTRLPLWEPEKCDEASHFHLCSLRWCAHFHCRM
jgi:hypothetical protein